MISVAEVAATHEVDRGWSSDVVSGTDHLVGRKEQEFVIIRLRGTTV